ncbi:MAG: NADH-quinone oxidoreductase subunit NuoE [Firmicutes bacterium]|nr:NADH-quinone oxidoreductase subunit NuoE [Bacillota bacterium]
MELIEGEKEFILESIGEILKYNDRTRENLIPILQQAQEKIGYLPTLAMERISELLDVPAVDVYSLATFYNQFRLTPPGKFQIKVCMGTACYMVGGQIALDSFERRLEIHEGETTPDREYSLEHVACVGCCTMAPVVVINEKVEGKVTPTKVDGILLALEDESKRNADAEKTNGEDEKIIDPEDS